MLAGGAGQDVFVFAGRFGADTIADFELGGGDRIDVSAFRFASFSQLLSYTKQIGDHSVITLASAASSITIQDVSKSLLTADDFVL
jgi:Ca2+-binding RTX toxin-like protein